MENRKEHEDCLPINLCPLRNLVFGITAKSSAEHEVTKVFSLPFLLEVLQFQGVYFRLSSIWKQFCIK